MQQQVLQKLLLVLDAQQPSQKAIDTALGLARQSKSQMVVIAFIIDMNILGNLVDMHVFLREELDGFVRDFETMGKKLFKEIRAKADKLGVKIDPILCQGRFYQVVLQCVKQFKTDSVVIGGWEQATTHKDAASIEKQLVADQVNVPVIIVK